MTQDLIAENKRLRDALEIFADPRNWLRPCDEETLPVWIGPVETTELIDKKPWEYAKNQLSGIQ